MTPSPVSMVTPGCHKPLILAKLPTRKASRRYFFFPFPYFYLYFFASYTVNTAHAPKENLFFLLSSPSTRIHLSLSTLLSYKTDINIYHISCLSNALYTYTLNTYMLAQIPCFPFLLTSITFLISKTFSFPRFYSNEIKC